MTIASYIEHTITYFRKNYVTPGVEINYQLIGIDHIKFKIPKEEYSFVTQNLKHDSIDFEVIPSDRKMVLSFHRHDGTQLCPETVRIDIYFVESASLKTIETIVNATELNTKNWADFFDNIDPEYRNLLSHIINSIPIAMHKNEFNKVISKKVYWIDPKTGLFEKKEKFVNGEWIITYSAVTSNLYQIFKMFFKYFEEPPLNELCNFEKFKDIVRKTKYRNHL